jgi:glyoxylase-like metal-dependent hydrolase (beta-lactamase superfamily II)
VTAPAVPLISSTILPGLHAIALPTPFAVGAVNAYVALSHPITLIDCGVRSPDSFRALDEGLAALGLTLRDVRRLVISHHHTDHMGGAQHVVETSGAAVYTHPLTVPRLETPTASRKATSEYAIALFRENGMPESVRELMARSDAYLDKLTGTIGVTGTLDEGDHFQMLDRSWRVLHTPGHAGDLICLFDPESRVLLASDHVLGRISSNPLIEPPNIPGDPRPRRLLEYRQHLERVAALDPTIAYTGHGDPVTDLPALIKRRFEQHRQRADKLLAMLKNGPCTVYDLSVTLFPHVPEMDSYLTMSETLGHLDMLEREGQAAPGRRADGLIEWAATA